jgi:hypothetical protein
MAAKKKAVRLQKSPLQQVDETLPRHGFFPRPDGEADFDITNHKLDASILTNF